MRSLSSPAEPDDKNKSSASAPITTEPTLVVVLSTNEICAFASVERATIAVLLVPPWTSRALDGSWVPIPKFPAAVSLIFSLSLLLWNDIHPSPYTAALILAFWAPPEAYPSTATSGFAPFPVTALFSNLTWVAADEAASTLNWASPLLPMRTLSAPSVLKNKKLLSVSYVIFPLVVPAWFKKAIISFPVPAPACNFNSALFAPEPPWPMNTFPPVTFIPLLAVINPTESTFVTSCLVSVPATETLPLNIPSTAVIFPVKVAPTPVSCPVRSRSPNGFNNWALVWLILWHFFRYLCQFFIHHYKESTNESRLSNTFTPLYLLFIPLRYSFSVVFPLPVLTNTGVTPNLIAILTSSIVSPT